MWVSSSFYQLFEARSATRDRALRRGRLCFGVSLFWVDYFSSWWVITLQQQQQQQRSISVLDGGCEAEAPRCWNSIRQRRTTKWREGWEGRKKRRGCRMGGRGGGVVQTWADCESSLFVCLCLSFFTSVCLWHCLVFPSFFQSVFLSLSVPVSFLLVLLLLSSPSFTSLSLFSPHLTSFSVSRSSFLCAFLSLWLSFILCCLSVSFTFPLSVSPSISFSSSLSVISVSLSAVLHLFSYSPSSSICVSASLSLFVFLDLFPSCPSFTLFWSNSSFLNA